ncbi:SOS response-associated peptidase [Coraliomargarita parva]|uniref:SOS response-associated peptidase n=1 Tax=Coraliomargarita parva TaxID=3014050 RepID=UPI0022B5AC90|nr:SOS response-associated peptidase [Coraliomargarita parva]
MCGRYTLHINKKKLAEAIGRELPDSYEPDFNIAPGREVLSLTADGAAPGLPRMMQWGLRTPQNFHINARIETADTSPRFRESWEDYRCLIPANGFYEWYQDGVTKQPYYFYPESGELLFYAGLWFPSILDENPASCVILTTAANQSVSGVHNRMPVILPQSCTGEWIQGRLPRTEAVRLAADCNLFSHTVSQRVNSSRNNDSRLVEATAPLTDDQMMLF